MRHGECSLEGCKRVVLYAGVGGYDCGIRHLELVAASSQIDQTSLHRCLAAESFSQTKTNRTLHLLWVPFEQEGIEHGVSTFQDDDPLLQTQTPLLADGSPNVKMRSDDAQLFEGVRMPPPRRNAESIEQRRRREVGGVNPTGEMTVRAKLLTALVGLLLSLTGVHPPNAVCMCWCSTPTRTCVRQLS